METITLNPRCWLIVRIMSRNPLLRRCDRIEALVKLVSIMVPLVAVPLAGATATAVYSASHTVVDAIAAALAVLLSAGITAGGLVAVTRFRVDRTRNAQWEREIRCLQDEGGGQANRP